MIEIELKNKKVLTVSDVHIQSTSSVIIAYSPSMADELYKVFSYPFSQWGSDRPAIQLINNTMMAKKELMDYYISIWLTSEPKNKNRGGSHLIISFFSNWNGGSIIDLIKENLPDLEKVFEDYCLDYDI